MHGAITPLMRDELRLSSSLPANPPSYFSEPHARNEFIKGAAVSV
jgi:hypothetical protein